MPVVWARGYLLKGTCSGCQLNKFLVKNQAVQEDWALSKHLESYLDTLMAAFKVEILICSI